MDLSIIIPTYKTGEYFRETINSIICQNLSNYKVEIIIILNGEREPYFDFICNVTGSLPSCKVVYTQIKGVSNARNIGIKESQGKYLLFLDDDDLLSENYINTILDKAIEEDTIYVSNVLCFKDGTNQYYKDYIGNFMEQNNKVDQSKGRFRIMKYSKLMSSSCFKLIPKKIIDNTRFNTKLSISEDALFMFAISKNIKGIQVLDNIFYYRRVRINSAMKVKKNKGIHIKNYLKFVSSLTIVYLKNIFRLNFYFYLNRLMASTKFMFNNIIK